MVNDLGSPGSGRGGPTRAERAFLQYVHTLEQDEEADFDAFCAEHPEIASELKSLYGAWRQVSGLLACKGAGFSMVREAERVLDADSGIPADAENSVYTSGQNAEDAAWQRLIEQLKTRGPGHTRYILRGEVGKGGMGVIHRVYDQDFRRHLAMKIILGKGGKGDSQKSGDTPDVDSRSLGRFLEEAQVTGQLDHPGIVPAHDLGMDEKGNVYFTMKLVKGEDLRSVFDRVHDSNNDSWNQIRALSLMLRVCEAMAYAHSKGVIHRDLKPSNIMVGKYGETYVMDWGLARVLGKQDQKDLRIRPVPTQSSTAVQSHRKDASGATSDSPLITMDGDVVGTPAYMSPEQARGELDQIGPQSDVYALGAMLYHLLAGHMPYVHPGLVANQHAIWKWVQQGPPEPMHKVARETPAELTAICEKAMSRTLADRYGDMEELAVDLRAFLEHRVVAAYESGAVAELKKWVKRNKGITVTAAAAVVVIGALTTWSVVSIRAERDVAEANERTALREKDRADENARIAKANENTALQEKRRADANAEQATRNAEEAQRNAEEMGRLSDVKTLSDLKTAMKELWPAHPDKAQSMRDWLARAQTLLEQQRSHEQTLKELRAQGTPIEHPRASELLELQGTATKLAQEFVEIEEMEDRTRKQEALDLLREQITSLEATIQREQPHEFGDEKLSWWHETLVGLVSGLVSFSEEDPYGEAVASVKERLRFAETIEEHSITYYQEEWDEARASIADPNECPKYDGLVLSEQLGLVPIGRDLESGLWEFWHVLSGEKPQRDEDGRLVLTEEMSLVFVLIPGGTFWMGSQATDAEGQNYDPQAEDDESDKDGKPVKVTLDAYFLSKYELTQGQWERFTGKNPSSYGPDIKFGDYLTTLLHPVEQVSREDCVEVLGRLGLRLPTEAQWEYGCRAGTETPWWAGTDKSELDQVANLSDQYCKANGGPSSWQYEPDLDDGFVAHARVGRYRANAFGLHDVIGNVWEWCLDDYGGYANVTRTGDGGRDTVGASSPVARGGSFNTLAAYARSAYRNRSAPGHQGNHLGARPATRVISD